MILLLLNIVGPRSKVMIHETKTPQWTLPKFLQLLGLLLHITPPLTLMYDCMCSLYPLGSKLPLLEVST